jgi:hypothetical protein
LRPIRDIPGMGPARCNLNRPTRYRHPYTRRASSSAGPGFRAGPVSIRSAHSARPVARIRQSPSPKLRCPPVTISCPCCSKKLARKSHRNCVTYVSRSPPNYTNPRYDSGRTHPYHPNLRPLFQAFYFVTLPTSDQAPGHWPLRLYQERGRMDRRLSRPRQPKAINSVATNGT